MYGGRCKTRTHGGNKTAVAVLSLCRVWEGVERTTRRESSPADGEYTEFSYSLHAMNVPEVCTTDAYSYECVIERLCFRLIFCVVKMVEASS